MADFTIHVCDFDDCLSDEEEQSEYTDEEYDNH